jgi:RHS repeat-associated protein
VKADGTTILASREYDAFGRIIASSGTWPGRFGYQGQAWVEMKSADGSQRFALCPVRTYDAADGRFLEKDSRLTDRVRQPYLYVPRNPISKVDVRGRGDDFLDKPPFMKLIINEDQNDDVDTGGLKGIVPLDGKSWLSLSAKAFTPSEKDKGKSFPYSYSEYKAEFSHLFEYECYDLLVSVILGGATEKFLRQAQRELHLFFNENTPYQSTLNKPWPNIQEAPILGASGYALSKNTPLGENSALSVKGGAGVSASNYYGLNVEAGVKLEAGPFSVFGGASYTAIEGVLDEKAKFSAKAGVGVNLGSWGFDVGYVLPEEDVVVSFWFDISEQKKTKKCWKLPPSLDFLGPCPKTDGP